MVSPTHTQNRWLATYSIMVAALAGAVATIGVVGRGNLDTTAHTTVRGETVDWVTSGVYANSPERLVAEGVAWDLFTLLVAVPALVVVAVGVGHGSLRARLATIGLFAYLAYQYLMYAVAWAVGPLLLPFVVVFVASWVGIVLILATIDVRSLPDHIGSGFPRRSIVALSVVMPLLLIGMWVPLIASVNDGQLEGNLHGQTTLVVQALDLGLVVPIGFLTAWLLIRRRAVAILMAAAVVVKALAMAWAIVAMVIAAWRIDGDLDLGGLVIFTVAGLASLALVIAVFRSIVEAPRPSAVPGSRVGHAPSGPATVGNHSDDGQERQCRESSSPTTPPPVTVS